MIISIIAAMDRNRLIGNNNQLPWHLPADLAHFKKVTLNKPILMGRKTYESIGRPLPGRENIVLTRSVGLEIEGVTVVNSLEAAIEGQKDDAELMVIGGSTIYELVLPRAQRMYLSYVDGEFEGDAWFPEFDESQWTISDSVIQEPDEKNRYGCRFITYERK
jgi:dihydrofolate reductase